MFILMVCKYRCGYIYQVVSGDFPFAETCSEKKSPENFLL